MTFVVPVWDRYVDWLLECVESILGQEAPTRVLVVDNASADPLPTLPAGVDVLRLPRRVSVGEARNAGLTQVETPLFSILDADDRLLVPSAFPFLVEQMMRRPELVAVAAGGSRVVRADGSYVETHVYPPPFHCWLASRFPRLFLVRQLWNYVFPHHLTVYRTSLLGQEVHFGDVEYLEDRVFTNAVCARGAVEMYPLVCRASRRHVGSLNTREQTRAELQEAFAVLARSVRDDRALPWWLRRSWRLYRRAFLRRVEKEFHYRQPGGRAYETVRS